MTPLDAALYRGFRGCAKFIQLHGGVPANKITDKAALEKALSRWVLPVHYTVRYHIYCCTEG